MNQKVCIACLDALTLCASDACFGAISNLSIKAAELIV
jgi:hypothetical protein